MNISKKLKIGIIAIVCTFSIPIFSNASNIEEEIGINKIEYNENGILEIRVPYNRTQNNINNLLTRKLGAYVTDKTYNLKDDITLKVKDQGETGLCWACSTDTAIETNMAKVNKENTILSESYLDEQTAKYYNRELNSEGNVLIALGYYTSGKGMQSQNGEKLNKIVDNYEIFPSIIKRKVDGETQYYDSTGQSLTSYDLNNIRNQIKNHILKYGSVTGVTYSSGNQYYSATESNGTTNIKSYYCDYNYAQADHQISIVGWDDNYSIYNFSEEHRPNKPGAYIIQNSWGEDIFENGYLYISYEDILIESQMIGVKETNDIDYQNLYQYDELGMNQVINLPSDMYGGNVYSRDSSKNDEYLYKIGISSLLGGKCEIYVNDSDDTLSSSTLTKVKTIDNLNVGYSAITLDKPIKLKGNKFSIVLKYFKDDTGYSYAAVEYNDGDSWSGATNQEGQSFISYDMENWEDIKQIDSVVKDANLCIKAYTKEMEIDKLEISSNIYKVSDDYIVNIVQDTTVNSFQSNVNSNINIIITDKSGVEAKNNDIIKTGMKLQGDDGTIYNLVVKGDLNGDGKVGLSDLSNIKLYLVGKKKLEKANILAGDVNQDGNTSLSDISKLKMYLVGKSTI